MEYKDLLTDADRSVLQYIRKEQNYIIVSGIFPVFMAFVNIINVMFVIYIFVKKLIMIERLVDVFAPLIISIVFSGFVLLQFIFLWQWRQKAKRYEVQEKAYKKIIMEDNNIGEETARNIITVHMTDLFYDIIEHMEKIKYIFIILNIFAIIYLCWAFDFFFIGIPNSVARTLVTFIWWLNRIAMILIMAYLIYEWIHFIKWSRKLSRIKKYERQIFEELNLNG